MTTHRPPLGHVALLAVTCALLLVALQSARARATRAMLRADSLEAVADTLRVTLTDSAAIWRRRAIQRPAPREAVVVVRPVLRLDTVRVVDTVTVTGDSVRRATFLRYQAPVTLRAEVALPPAPAPGTLSATLTVDPIPVGVRIACGPVRGGWRPVEAVVTTPAGVALDLAPPVSDPVVCNAPQSPRWWSSGAIAVAIGVVAGLALR